MPPSNSPRPPSQRPKYRNRQYDDAEETETSGLDLILNELKVTDGEVPSVDDVTREMKRMGFSCDDNKLLAEMAEMFIKCKVNADGSTTANSAMSPTSSFDRSGLSKENSEPPATAATAPRSSSRTKRIVDRLRNRSRSRTPKRETAATPPKPRTPLRSQSPHSSLLFRRGSKVNGDVSFAAGSKPPPTPFAPTPTPFAADVQPPVNTPPNSYPGFLSPPSTILGDNDSSFATTPFTLNGDSDHDVSITTPMVDISQEEIVNTGDHKKRNKATTTPAVSYFGQAKKNTPPLPAYNPVTSPAFNVDLSKNNNRKPKGGARLKRATRKAPVAAFVPPPAQPFVAQPAAPFVAPVAQPNFVAPAFVTQPSVPFVAPVAQPNFVAPDFAAQPSAPFVAPVAQPNFVAPAFAAQPSAQHFVATAPAASSFGAPPVQPNFGVATSFSFDAAGTPSPVRTFGAPAAAAAYPQQNAFQQNNFHRQPSMPTMSTPYNVQQATVPTSSFKSPMPGLEFNLGTVSPSHKSSRRRTAASTNPRRRGRPEQNRAPPQPSFTPAVAPSASQDSSSYAESAAADTASAASSSARNVDYSGHKARIEAYRTEARDHYTNGNYKMSVIAYTNALSTYTREAYAAQESGPDDDRAILLANRAAALLMLGAYEASAYDCKEASRYASELTANANGEYNFSTEGGPILKAKALTRMGRALIKLGKLADARAAFDLALKVVLAASEVVPRSDPSNPVLVHLNSIHIDSTSGMTEVNRCQESVDVVKSCGLTSPKDAEIASRRVNLRALSNINSALMLAPGSIDLIEMKLAVLGALSRWREVYICCEHFAAHRVKFDGVFTLDLEGQNPLRHVPQARYLKAAMFDGEDGTTVKLATKAIAEVILRLPANIQPLYIRSLRLEERCHQALAAVDALVDFLDQYLPCMERVNYSWLTKETDTIHRTIMSKDMGDSLFRTGDYLGAVAQYSACILIDCEDRAGNPQDVGGRLNAVLHCNRAAANMSLSKYREAISDCSAALHIHSLYMKAMLRRSRCYVRLNRFEEAQAELLRYINLVETAHAAGASSTGYQNTPCIFDAPKDIGADDLETARGELKELQRAKINAEHAKRAEEAERVNKQKRYQETFGQSKADAEQRRQQWYNQQDNNSSRRWDSFSGRGPHRGPHPGANPNHSYKQSSPNRGSYRARPEPPRAQSYRSRNSSREEQKPAAVSSPITETTSCHYKVLNVPRDASLELIKKAYKKAALKYHPDKNRGDNSATDLFRRARLAWEVLKDPVQKRSYDQELRWGGR